ncbi:MAG: hypothetical protein JWR61_1342 [Ferruginibacter sp.]|uniref:hypothetical protein n=1 Tax=Ferruginibacter sp. TaxID=1940288 RepID=UPI00265AC1A4|nr:hypothetical protein [Ferruginibacter sp.]MDB5276387.1 hypothetical protein [Ferruginibacter sp.]
MTDSLEKIKKQIRFLSVYAVFSSLLLIFALFLIFRMEKQTEKLSVEELTAKRINIIEPNGQYRMILSNKEKSPENLFYGKPIGMPGGNRPGIIFFNDEATECGGLVFSGRKDSSGKYFASGHFSFDQYNQNQVLYFQYLDDNGDKKTGLYVDDWHNSPTFPEFRNQYKATEKLPAGPDRDLRLKQLMEPLNGDPAFAHRVFIGKDTDKSALINLADKKGKTRIQLIVDSTGAAKINFLDSAGKVVYSLPDKEHH